MDGVQPGCGLSGGEEEDQAVLRQALPDRGADRYGDRQGRAVVGHAEAAGDVAAEILGRDQKALAGVQVQGCGPALQAGGKVAGGLRGGGGLGHRKVAGGVGGGEQGGAAGAGLDGEERGQGCGMQVQGVLQAGGAGLVKPCVEDHHRVNGGHAGRLRGRAGLGRGREVSGTV